MYCPEDPVLRVCDEHMLSKNTVLSAVSKRDDGTSGGSDSPSGNGHVFVFVRETELM
jgi:hypothetical protein